METKILLLLRKKLLSKANFPIYNKRGYIQQFKPTITGAVVEVKA